MMKLAIAVFLAGLIGCWSSSSRLVLPHRRMMHRSLEASEECVNATEALFDNAALQSAIDASLEDTADVVGECIVNLSVDIASGGGGGDCTVDAAGLSSSTALEEACQAAGGEVYVIDFTFSCTVDGTGSTITGGVINDVNCLGTPCTRDEVQSEFEDSEEDEFSGLSGFTCTFFRNLCRVWCLSHQDQALVGDTVELASMRTSVVGQWFVLVKLKLVRP